MELLTSQTGTYYLGDLLVEVGKVSVGGSYVRVNLNNKFKNPVVLTDIQTFNNGIHSLFTRVRNIEPDSFEVQIESDDSSNPSISNEVVGYMVIEAGTDSNLKLEAKKVSNINQNFATQTFSLSYSSPPVVITQLVSENGGDQAYAVTRDVTSNDFELALEEPASRDGSHVNENFNWIAIPSGVIYGAIWTEGKFGNALTFDGINDYVNVSYGGGTTTAAVWIYNSSLGDWITGFILCSANYYINILFFFIFISNSVSSSISSTIF